MATETLTLTAFLLARIAERDADVRRRGTTAVGHAERCIYEGGYEGTFHCDCGAVEHALAECEAKRRIVEKCLEIEAVDWWEYDDAPNLAYDVVELLALPYADHPDYRTEWRPT